MRAFTMLAMLASVLAGTTAHAQTKIVPGDANKEIGRAHV